MKRISMSASSARLAHRLAVLIPAVNSEVRQVHEDLFDGRCFVVTQAVEFPFVENERLVEVAADLDLVMPWIEALRALPIASIRSRSPGLNHAVPAFSARF